LHLFAQHGYAATSVREIAREAGVSQALLYNWYRSKEALLEAIFERSRRNVRASLRTALKQRLNGGGLEMLVRSALQVMRKNQSVWRLSHQLRLQPEVLPEIGDADLWSDVLVPEATRLLQEAGSTRAAVEARALVAALDGAAQSYIRDPEAYPLEEVTEVIVHRFAPGAPST
jgi:AcrR family transcriptional regulator